MSLQQVPGKQQLTPILAADSRFHFACHEDLPCFTQCCRNVNIYLTPYDVLRLRRATGMASGEFLQKYTRHFLAKVTHVPVVQFDLEPDTLRCRFLSDDGCQVYDDRPWACRMYPLDLVPGKPDHYQVMVAADRCFGLLERREWTVREWLEVQGVAPYEAMERAYHAVMPDRFQSGQQLNPGIGKLLFLAYDLDRFTEIIADERLRRFYDIDQTTLKEAREDDERLLQLAFRYIRTQMEELLDLA